VLVAAACAPTHRERPMEMSGFLDDYSLLREGGPDEVGLVYRDPDARWTSYRKVLLEPVTLWRSGRRSLASVPEKDLLRLVSYFQATVRKRLGDGFALVDRPGAGVMRIRLAITQARASDPVLDIVTAHGDGRDTGGGSLDPEMRRFLADATIEGDIRDAESGRLLAEGVERRRPDRPAFETWADVERALDFWADRVCSRLEARAGARSH
jgi:hypothetical protein